MIKNIEILPNKLKVLFSDKSEDIFLNLWLRDHAKDNDSWDSRSNQRKIFTAKIDPKLSIKKAKIKNNGRSIEIIWSDLNRPIDYSYKFFLDNSKNKKITKTNFKIWKYEDLDEDLYFDFEEVISEYGFKSFLKKLYNQGFVVIQNCKTEKYSVERIAKKIHAFYPKTCAYTMLNNQRIRFGSVEVLGNESTLNKTPGTLIVSKKNRNAPLIIQCGVGALKILLLQKAGGKWLDANAFVNGFKGPHETILRKSTNGLF